MTKLRKSSVGPKFPYSEDQIKKLRSPERSRSTP